MEYNTILDIGKRKRQNSGINEDSLGVATHSTGHRDDEREAALFVIADGAGGHQDGDVASYIASNTVLEELSGFLAAAERRRPDATAVELQASITDGAPDGTEIRERLTEAIEVAHADILEYASEAKAEPMTTIVVALIYDGFVHFAWVGDSRAYLINSAHDQISLLTRDHSTVEKKRQNGEVSDIEAEVHPQGNQITRALGGNQYDDPEMRPVDVDTGTVPLYREDKLLVTSDGLIDGWTDAPNYHSPLVKSSGNDYEEIKEEILRMSVTDDEIRDTVLDADSLKAANETLVDIANERGGKDNISIIIADPDVGGNSPDPLPPRGIDEEETKVSEEETVIMEGDDTTGNEETDRERQQDAPESGDEPTQAPDADSQSASSGDEEMTDEESSSQSSGMREKVGKKVREHLSDGDS
jgi:serine/threonine protein phosphatase PrpC